MLSVPDGPGHGFILYIVPLCCLGLSCCWQRPVKRQILPELRSLSADSEMYKL